MEGDVAAAERELRRHAVDPGHVRVGDDLDRPRPRDELLQQLERSDPDVDARCSEHDAVRVVGVRLRGLLVQWQPLPEERLERLLVERERPALPRSRAPTRRPDSTSSSTVNARRASVVRVVSREDSAAAERDRRPARLSRDRRGEAASRSRNAGSPSRANSSSIVAPASRSISRSRSTNVPAEPSSSLLAQRRLARTHEACEREVTIQGVRGHSMRARYARCAATKSAIASPPNLSLAAPGQLEGHDRLGHDCERLDRLHVRALHERLGRLAGVEVDASRAASSGSVAASLPRERRPARRS